jgi:uncharacterized membrane protein YkvA (DUF1232 family)
MDAFFQFLQALVIGFVVVVVVFLILMALPKSRLRDFIMEVLGWTTTATSAVSVISPLDPIPDFIPLAGQLDDVGMLAIGIVSALFAWRMRKHRKKLETKAVDR